MSKTLKNKDLQYYMDLEYPIEITRCDGEFIAEYPDLPGCLAQGSTEKEAKTKLKEGREAWFRVTLELGLPIPLPHGTLPEVELEVSFPGWKKDFELPSIKNISPFGLVGAA